jgi:hypothetical protein
MSARIFDKALELRNVADGAETSTANEAAINVDVLNMGEFKAVLNVTAIDRTTGDETYVFDISVSDASGGTFTKVATLPAITAVGTYEIPLSGELVRQHDDDADWVRVGCTLGGTSPSITYGAFLTKV